MSEEELQGLLDVLPQSLKTKNLLETWFEIEHSMVLRVLRTPNIEENGNDSVSELFEDPVALNKEYEIICCKYFIPSITERI